MFRCSEFGRKVTSVAHGIHAEAAKLDAPALRQGFRYLIEDRIDDPLGVIMVTVGLRDAIRETSSDSITSDLIGAASGACC